MDWGVGFHLIPDIFSVDLREHMIALTKKTVLLFFLFLAVSLCLADQLTVTNSDFELPEIISNLVIFDPNDWVQIPGWNGGPYTTPTGQRAGESGIQRSGGITGNAAYGNSNCGDVYQLLSSEYVPGCQYRLSAYAKNSWYGETVTVEFYYLPDEQHPTARTVLASQTVTIDDGSNTDHDWILVEVDLEVGFDDQYVGQKIGIQFSGTGSGDRTDPGRAWFLIDDITVHQTFIYDVYPTDEAGDVPINVTLSWAAPQAITAYSYDVYFCQASEPNIPLVSHQQTQTSYPIPYDLEYNTTYHWRIDTHTDPNTCAGQIWTFTTLAVTPQILTQPDPVAIFAGEDGQFQVDANSVYPLTYSWYNSEDNSSDTPSDDSLIQTGSSDTLDIPAAQIADEGFYYCVVEDAVNTPAFTDPAGLAIKRPIAYYELDGNCTDSVGTYNLTASGSPVYVTGPDTLGDAIDLDGTDDRAFLNIGDMDFFAGFTLSLWAKTDSVSQSQGATLFHLSPSIVIDVDSSGNYRYAGDDDCVFGEIPNDEWVLLTITCDGQNSTLYYNGVAVDEVAKSYHIIKSLGLGIDSTLSLNTIFEGAIDDVQLYNYPLDKFGVYDLYYAVVPEQGCVNDYASESDVSGPDGVPDCVIDMYDLAVFAQYWMACGLYPSCR